MENKANTTMFLSIPLKNINGNTAKIKRFLVNVLLNPNLPADAIEPLLLKVLHENICENQFSNIYEKTKIDELVLERSDRKVISNRISTWENIFGKLSTKDWAVLFEEVPHLLKIFPDKNAVTPISLANLISQKVKGQMQPMLKLSLYLYEFVTYWNNSVNGIAALKPLNSRLIIGESGSGKTYSIIQNLFCKAVSNPVVITIVGESIPNLKAGALRDALDIYNNSESPESYDKTTPMIGNNRFFRKILICEF